MITKSQKIRLGIFLSVSTFIFVSIIVILTGSKILEKRDTYFVRYSNVSIQGLEIGSQVKYNGIPIGRVENIALDPKDVESIIIEVSIKNET
ncbi:MCE family protein, partial [bacterium]|nr:MCE family protein [bacterium]